MTNPLRKENFDEAELTTADIAQGARSTESKEARRPIRSERSGSIASFPERSSIAEGEVLPASPQTETQNRADGVNGTAAPLFTTNEAQTFHARWSEVQASFVDEPRKAVEQADSLVAATMKRLAEVFAEERTKLEHQWDRGDNVSTEDLRVALQRYRSFFQRLLSI
jgi:hypothetical protein